MSDFSNKNPKQNISGSGGYGPRATHNPATGSKTNAKTPADWIKNGQVDIAAMMRDMAEQMHLPQEQKDMIMKQIPELQGFVGNMTEFIEHAMQSQEGVEMLAHAETKEGSARFMAWLFKKLLRKSETFIEQLFMQSLSKMDFSSLTKNIKEQPV